MFKKGIISLTLLLCLVWLIVGTQGCGEGDNQLLSEAMRDDGIEPNTPTWKSIPYDVEKVSEDRYRVTLYWNKVTTNKLGHPKANIAGYKILKSDVNENLIDTFWTGTRSGSQAEYFIDTDTGNIENKRYIYRIIAFDTYLRDSSASAPQLVNIIEAAGEKPRAPSDFNYVVMNEQQIVLYWKPVTSYQDGTNIDQNLKGYEIYRSTTTTRPDIPLALVSQDVTSYVDSELDYDETYYYWISAVDLNGAKSSYSDPLHAKINLTSQPNTLNDAQNFLNFPAAPHMSSISSTNNSNGTVTWTLYWERPLYNADKTVYEDHALYKIYRCESPEGFYQLVGVSSTTEFWFTVPTIINYYFRVTAVDQYSNESLPSGTGYDKASLPNLNKSTLNFRLGPSDDEEVMVRWNDVGVGSENDYYYLYRSLRPEGPYAQVGGGSTDDDRATDYEVLDTTVVKDVTYYYRLRGSNSSGLGGYTYYVKSGAEATTASWEVEEMDVDAAFPGLATYTGEPPTTSNTPSAAIWSDAGASAGTSIMYTPDFDGPTINDDYLQWESPIRKSAGVYKVRIRYKNTKDDAGMEMGNYRIDIYRESWFGVLLRTPEGTPRASISIQYDDSGDHNEAYMYSDYVDVDLDRDKYIYFRAYWTGAGQATQPAANNGRLYIDAVDIELK